MIQNDLQKADAVLRIVNGAGKEAFSAKPWDAVRGSSIVKTWRRNRGRTRSSLRQFVMSCKTMTARKSAR